MSQVNNSSKREMNLTFSYPKCLHARLRTHSRRVKKRQVNSVGFKPILLLHLNNTFSGIRLNFVSRQISTLKQMIIFLVILVSF